MSHSDDMRYGRRPCFTCHTSLNPPKTLEYGYYRGVRSPDGQVCCNRLHKQGPTSPECVSHGLRRLTEASLLYRTNGCNQQTKWALYFLNKCPPSKCTNLSAQSIACSSNATFGHISMFSAIAYLMAFILKIHILFISLYQSG